MLAWHEVTPIPEEGPADTCESCGLRPIRFYVHFHDGPESDGFYVCHECQPVRVAVPA